MASGQELVNVALKEKGTKESGTNNVKYNTWYHGREVSGEDYPWCAVFVSWCANQLGIPTTIIPKTASAGAFAAHAKKGNGTVYTKGTPQAGDLFLSGYDNNSWAKHVGIVVSCDGSSITTIEGNSSDMVLSRTLNISDLTFVRFNLDGAGGTMTANWVEREVPNIGKDLATKAYMAYQAITATSTNNYKLAYSESTTTHTGGLRVYKKSFYQIAMASYYGGVGTYVKIQFDDGNIIYGIITDEKKDNECDARKMYHDYPFDRNVLEFLVDKSKVARNDQFTEALKSANINRASRIAKIWTSDTEPAYGANADSGETITYNFTDTSEKIPLHPTIFKQIALFTKKDIALYVNDIEISQYAGNYTWQNSVDELATTFNFDVPKANGTKFINMYTPQEGDIIRFFVEKKEIYRGVVIEYSDGNPTQNQYKTADVGWYLNKTTDTYQFEQIRADECIKKLCNDLSIPIVYISDMPHLISGIYIDKPISDIIRDIASADGGIFNFDFVSDGIRIYKSKDMIAKPQFRLSSNTELKDSLKYHGEITSSKSIENMVTAVKVISDTDVLFRLQDNDYIKQYGFIQQVINASDEDNIEQLAKQAMNTKIEEKLSFSIIEDISSYTRSGYIIELGENVRYLIRAAQHSIKNGVHYNALELERIEIQ